MLPFLNKFSTVSFNNVSYIHINYMLVTINRKKLRELLSFNKLAINTLRTSEATRVIHNENLSFSS